MPRPVPRSSAFSAKASPSGDGASKNSIARLLIEAILDNYAAHKLPKVGAWLDRHPRWTFHFVPTSCSWLNAVEGFFAKLAKRRLKRGVFRPLTDLQAAIDRFLEEHNRSNSRPFTWTADREKSFLPPNAGTKS